MTAKIYPHFLDGLWSIVEWLQWPNCFSELWKWKSRYKKEGVNKSIHKWMVLKTFQPKTFWLVYDIDDRAAAAATNTISNQHFPSSIFSHIFVNKINSNVDCMRLRLLRKSEHDIDLWSSVLRCFSIVWENSCFPSLFFLKLRVLVHFLRTFHPKSRFPTKMTRGGTKGSGIGIRLLRWDISSTLAGRCGNGAEMY